MKINFLKYSSFFLIVSGLLTLAGLALIFTKGFRYGIDFAGGNEIQIQFQEMPSLDEIRTFLTEENYGNARVQSFGQDQEILIRMEESKLEKVTELTAKIKERWAGAEIRRVDSVGPQIGSELKRNGILAVCYSLLLILIYLGLRFDYNYAPSAVFCLFHDSILTMAIFSFFDREVNVQTLAAVLAIIGYSLNDTIVTFDRIRENVALYSRKESFAQICNRSLNDVLSRTLLTSITTMMAVLAMWFLTSGVIKDFAFTLGIGVVIGTYSSIYVATPLTVRFQLLKSVVKGH
ncbi:MAG: protein translocase subunit SecF [Bdellovibrionales bacterium]|nr:protein translocase subunit SecF [Bdellovibrionales bacterium]